MSIAIRTPSSFKRRLGFEAVKSRNFPHVTQYYDLSAPTWNSLRGTSRSMMSIPNDEDKDAITSSAAAAGSWRKHQLENLETKFTKPNRHIQNDEELQPMWKEMESRVTRRRPKTVHETGGKTGRSNVKRTDEEMWLKEGLYDD